MLDCILARTHAITTPQPCQDRKVAAIRDACDRRGLRVTLVSGYNGLEEGLQIFPRLGLHIRFM